MRVWRCVLERLTKWNMKNKVNKCQNDEEKGKLRTFVFSLTTWVVCLQGCYWISSSETMVNRFWPTVCFICEFIMGLHHFTYHHQLRHIRPTLFVIVVYYLFLWVPMFIIIVYTLWNGWRVHRACTEFS